MENQEEIKKLVITYGRFQPPTIGHEKLFECVKELSDNLSCPHVVFISPKMDTKDNPLVFSERLFYLKQLFPDIVFSDLGLPSLWDVLKNVSDIGYNYVLLVSGGDRIEKYRREFSKYINHPDPEKNLNFKYFDISDSGERSKVSGSYVRNLISQNKYKEYEKYIPGDKDDIKEEIFGSIRETYGLPIY